MYPVISRKEWAAGLGGREEKVERRGNGRRLGLLSLSLRGERDRLSKESQHASELHRAVDFFLAVIPLLLLS